MTGMVRRLVGLVGVAVAAVGGVGVAPAVAAGSASPPVSGARVVAHFSLAGGQQPQNVAVEPDGSVDLTFATARQVARVTRGGRVRVVATLPAPPRGATCPVIGAPLVAGIVRAPGGPLYVNYCTQTPGLHGVWRIQRGRAPVRIAALPVTGLPNGLALDRRTGYLYVADSVLGVIWRVRTSGGRPVVWARGPALTRTGFVGANGVKVHGNAVWVSNTDRATLLRIPFGRGGVAGPVQTRVTGLATIDDFAFTGSGDTVLVAFIRANQVGIVYPNGTRRTVLTAADGLSNPSSLAVRGTSVYVPSAATFTRKDPNLLLARLRR